MIRAPWRRRGVEVLVGETVAAIAINEHVATKIITAMSREEPSAEAVTESDRRRARAWCNPHAPRQMLEDMTIEFAQARLEGAAATATLRRCWVVLSPSGALSSVYDYGQREAAGRYAAGLKPPGSVVLAVLSATE